MTDSEQLLEQLSSPNWDVAVRAAEALKDLPGERVTRALAEALDAHDTAITDAAARSLIARDDQLAVEIMWDALMTLDDDVTDQVWSVLDGHPDNRISRELNRRYANQLPPGE